VFLDLIQFYKIDSKIFLDLTQFYKTDSQIELIFVFTYLL